MTVSRRDFLSACAAAIGAGRLARAANADSPLVQTVLGGVPAETLGPTLMHEHLLVDFIGAASVSRDRYEADAVVARMLPVLEQLRAEGGRTLVDATPAWIGRDPTLLRRLSGASGIAIVTTTGYYGAANDKFRRRFRSVERQAAEQGVALRDLDFSALDALWDAAKAEELTEPAT